MNASNRRVSPAWLLPLLSLFACETNVDALGPREAVDGGMRPDATTVVVDAGPNSVEPDAGVPQTDAGSDPCATLDTVVEAGGLVNGFYADDPVLLTTSETRVAVHELIPETVIRRRNREPGPRVSAWNWTGGGPAATYALDETQRYFELASNPGGCPFALFAQDGAALRMDLVGPFCGSVNQSVANDTDVLAPVISGTDLFFASTSRQVDELRLHVRRGDASSSMPVSNQPAEDVHIVPLGFVVLDPPAIPPEPVVIHRLRTSDTQIAAVRPGADGTPQREYHPACAAQALDVATDGFGVVYAVGRCGGQVRLSTFHLNDACQDCPPPVDELVGTSATGPAPRVAYDGRRVAVVYWGNDDVTPTVRFFDRQGAPRAAGGLLMRDRFVGQPQMTATPVDLAISGDRGRWAVAYSYDVPHPMAGGTLARFGECETN